MHVFDILDEPTATKTPLTWRPSAKIALKVGAAAAALVLVAYVAHDGNQRQLQREKTFETDRVAYDEIKEITNDEITSISWDKPKESSQAAEAILSFGDSIGVDMMTAQQLVYHAPENGKDGFVTYESRLDLEKAKTIAAEIVDNMETPDGWNYDRFRRQTYFAERYLSGGYFGNVSTPGQAIVELEQQLESPSGIAVDGTPEQKANLAAFLARNLPVALISLKK